MIMVQWFKVDPTLMLLREIKFSMNNGKLYENEFYYRDIGGLERWNSAPMEK